MTIAIAVQVHDGVVLASDSASTMTTTLVLGQPPQIVNVYNNANKIFNLRKGLAIGGMTCGSGSIGSASIATLAKDLRARFTKPVTEWTLDPGNYTIEEVAIAARRFFFEEHWVRQEAQQSGGPFSFYVAGYSANSPLAETWVFEVLNNQCAPSRKLLGPGDVGVNAGGDPEAFHRLVFGHGQQLGAALLKGGVPPDRLAQVVELLRDEMRVQLFEAPMPIQDAIDFAEFLVSTTVGFTRFKRGAPTVGGPLESAAITKHEGFKWVHRKHYFDRSLNPENANG